MPSSKPARKKAVAKKVTPYGNNIRPLAYLGIEDLKLLVQALNLLDHSESRKEWLLTDIKEELIIRGQTTSTVMGTDDPLLGNL